MRNTGITVNFGREHAVDPNRELVIDVKPGDSCKVVVLPEPLSQIPGKLTPSEFPCDFEEGELKYVHFGSRLPPSDRVKMQLLYSTDTEHYIIPFTMEVRVNTAEQLEIVTRSEALIVDQLKGISDAITSNKLEFATVRGDSGDGYCQVTIFSKMTGLPRYGDVINLDRIGQPVECNQFLNLNVAYQHTADTTSPRRDYIPAVVELKESELANSSVVQQEYFQIMVRINGGQDNTPPLFNIAKAMWVLEVDQFIMTAITPDVLAATDIETDDRDLVFNITTPLGPGEGYIVSTDDRNQPISSFTQADVEDLKIAYVPPADDSDEQRVFEVQLEVVDSELLTSDPESIMFVVFPKNTLAPIATRNTGVSLFEGQSRVLRPDLNLEISDEDNLNDVIIAPIDGLRHGQLRVRGVVQKFFTISDLRNGFVTYHHDGTDTYSDNIIFRMTDGQNEVEFLFPVTIMALDDEPPIVDVNTGILINETDTMQITANILSATDIDSEDMFIKFIIEPPYSTESEFILRQTNRPADPQNWINIGGYYEQPVTEFLLKDITEGRLYYRHIGDHRTGVYMDRIYFHVADNSEPPNQSPVEEFIAKVLPVDTQPPYLYPGTTLSMTVSEFELTTILKSALRYTDVDSNDRDLLYLITMPPTDLDIGSTLPSPGHLVRVEEPNIPITSFTQGMINHHKIAYQPPNRELGTNPRMIQFEFSVSDPEGNSAPPQRFNILLEPVNNQPPSVVNPGFIVQERANKSITPNELMATDEDSLKEDLRFTVLQGPQHGLYLYKGTPLLPGDTFGIEDIEIGNLMYMNSGAEEIGDRIYLEVTDGIHTIPVDIVIGVIPIDDEAPTIQLPEGALGSYLEVLEQTSSLITSNILSATDEDTEDLMLTFILDRYPQQGIIESNGFPVDRFTQSDIVNGYVRYQHTGGEIGMSSVKDSFNLTISDMSDEYIVGGNRITEIEVYVTILPMDNVAPIVIILQDAVVEEGGKVPITFDNINVTDVDTNDDDIVCTIVDETQYGYLENISPAPGSEKSRAGRPISAFTVRDLRLNHINYVQTIHQDQEPESDRFRFYCSDGSNPSGPQFLEIDITSTNDEPPKMFTGDFIVEEGETMVIDLPRLSATDGDIPEDELHFYVISPPVNGRIVYLKDSTPVPALNFTLDQIASGLIKYEHDGSETTEDSMTVLLTDGTYEVTKDIPIVIIPKDDETPRLTINDGLWLDIGESSLITNRDLMATDMDSPDSNLTYVIRYLPDFGLLQRLDKLNPDVVSENLTVGMTFTQWEIDNRRIRYVHTGSTGGRDKIKFDVTDGTNPHIDRYFYITINEEDNVYPDVINTGVELPEGGRVTLTTDVLTTTDLNSPDENLRFTITTPPAKGHLESTDNPGVPITTFTQLELAGNKIVYVHTSQDEMKMDSFQFEVTDGLNYVVRTFRISLSEVDNQYPVVSYQSLTLKEGGHKLITPFELSIHDRDTPDPASLVFTITQLPVRGNLLYNNTRPVVTFTMDDIYNNLISYQHDGSETSTDSFSFTVSDGTHNKFHVSPDLESLTQQPQRVPINIFAVDNGLPQMVINRGAPTLMVLNTGELGFMITNKFLRSEDRDSEDSSLVYIVTIPPEYGYLVNVNMGNVSITNFTQGDIDNMFIQYILYPRVNATSDTYTFSVIDSGGNELPNQQYRLNWAFISLEREFYQVNETERYLEIKLLRRGYLGETSFVGIETADGTAVSPEDFKGKSARQVQFNPGQTMGFWRVRIQQDDDFEQVESFEIVLNNPVMGALEFPDRALVQIRDFEDESTVVIDLEGDLIVEENDGEILIPIRRRGDLSEEFMVMCSTMPDTATGSDPSPVLSFSDYLSRLEDDPDNFVRFEKGEDVAHCRILIIDDSLYEDDEQFQVKLTMPMGGQIGGINTINVVIAADADDVPSFYFIEPEYNVDESAGFVEVQVWRAGSDLSKMSSITVRSKPSEPPSAIAGEDYTGISRNLDFAPGVTMQTVRVYIQDDLGQPRLEGEETFELVLRMPMNAVLGSPDHTVITINDTVSDLPKVQFVEPEVEVNENDGNVSVTIIRSGDLSIPSSVRCYTRQGSAQVMMDYDERPNNIGSVITFLPGEREKKCTVLLMGDNLYEPDEQFRIVLGDPRTGSGLQAMIGGLNESIVTVHDIGDRPIIKFPETRFTVSEPLDPEGVTIVHIPVIRMGDTSQTSVVRVYTKDGSAKSGIDYNPLSQELEFGFNVSQHMVEIEVLPDEDRTEMREAFTVHLTMDEFMIADIQMNRAIIYIQQEGQSAGVTFPSPPLVVSLLNYDNPAIGVVPRGYPVVCITACNPKHPEFGTSGQICTDEGLNNTLTQYRWMISAPTSNTGVTSPLKQVDSDTFFTSTKMVTLDSIYFGPGSRVQCVARPVGSDGVPGREASSNIVTVSTEEGMCMPRDADEIGAEPFNARLRYVGPNDPDHANKVRITVTMPHVDGLLPAISTRQLSNFELALSKDGYRVGTHRCSNLLDYDELPTDYGFVNEETKNPNVIGEIAPYQFDSALRSDQTLRFYRNLDLESCLWEFTTYYDMSELLEQCGGIVGTDGQVLDLVQSYVSMRVPLYVSYIFHSPGASGGWQHFDQQSQMQLTFVYDTSILWDNGIGAQSVDSTLSGNLYPTSMRIDQNGRLVVNFRTEALFSGLFVLDHPSSQLSSSVISVDHPGLTYTLTLLRSEPTFAQPDQLWQFVSDNAVSDYSGSYTIRLVPCSTSPNQIYDIPPVCNPRQPVVFDLPIRFQQVSDPVPAEYSLSTDFLLLTKEMLWLSDGSMGFAEDTDAAFAPGDTIYGRIHVDPVQNLGEGFKLQIEKVFLCSGRDGYIPKYDPRNGEYGCVADSPNLLYDFKILDYRAPTTVETNFNGVPFEATLAADIPALELVRQSGADGFTMNSNALYQVDAGRQWYLHAIYSLHSADGSNIFKREVHSLGGMTNAKRQRRAGSIADLEGVGESMGTNMHLVSLGSTDGRSIVDDFNPKGSFDIATNDANDNGNSIVTLGAIIGLIALIVLVVILIVVVLTRRRRSPPAAAATTVKASNGSTKVVAHVTSDGDNTEV